MAPGVSGLLIISDSAAQQVIQQEDHAGAAVVQHHALSQASQRFLDNALAIFAKEYGRSLSST